MSNMFWRASYTPISLPQTAKAPSERALENWIWDHPEQFGTIHDMTDCYGEPDTIIPFGKVIGRQITVPSGIIDLLIIDEHNKSVVVVELKKGKLDTKPFAQVLRYMYDLREMFLRMYEDCGFPSDSDDQEYRYRLGTMHDMCNGSMPEILGVIIGHDITDSNLLIACETAFIDAYVYRKFDSGYRFYSAMDVLRTNHPAHEIMSAHAAYKEHVPDVLKNAFLQVMHMRSSEEKQYIVSREIS